MYQSSTKYVAKTLFASWLSIFLALILSSNVFASAGVDLSISPASDNPPPTTPLIDGGEGTGQEGTAGSEEGQEDGSDSSKSVEESEAGASVTNYQHNEYFFDTTSWISALLHTLSADSSKSANKYKPILKEAAKNALGLLLDFDTDGINGIGHGQLVGPAQRIWKVSFGVALALFPLVMVVNVFLVYSQGLGAGTARAEMVQNLIEGMVLLGIAWGSYILVNHVISIGWGLASFIMEVEISGSAGSKYAVVEQVVAGVIRIASGNFPGIIFFYLTVFFLIFAFMLLGALKLSYYAMIVVAVMCVVIAPIVIVLGGIPQFKWIYGLWMKILSGVLLLPIFNALMIRLWATLTRSGPESNILVVVTNLGLLSLLITINGKVGQFTFGPVLEAGKKALGATLMVGKLLVSAAAIASGGSGAAPAASGVLSSGGRGGPGGASSNPNGENFSLPGNDTLRGRPFDPKAGLQAEATPQAAPSKNSRGVSTADIMFRPGKVARAAAEGRISPEQMNRLALAGKLTETMFRNDPMMRTLTTPMRHGIDSGLQAVDKASWTNSNQGAPQKDFLQMIPNNNTGSRANESRTLMPSRTAFSGAMLNHSNPSTHGIRQPEGFSSFSNQAYSTVEQMTRAAQAKGIDPFGNLPQNVTREQFAAAAGYMLSPAGITSAVDGPGLNPMNQTVANSIFQQVQRFSEGGASSVSAALQDTIRDIEEGVLTQLDPQSLISQFSRNLIQVQSDHNSRQE